MYLMCYHARVHVCRNLYDFCNFFLLDKQCTKLIFPMKTWSDLERSWDQHLKAFLKNVIVSTVCCGWDQNVSKSECGGVSLWLRLSAFPLKRCHFYQDKLIWMTQVQKSWVLGCCKAEGITLCGRAAVEHNCRVCKESGHLRILSFLVAESTGLTWHLDLPDHKELEVCTLAEWELGLAAGTLLKCGSKQNSYRSSREKILG